MRVSIPALVLFIGLLGAMPGHAQFRDQSVAAAWTHARQPSPADQPPSYVILQLADPRGAEDGASTVWLTVAGVAGGGVGMFGGMIVGGLLAGPPDERCIDFCFSPGLIPGALIGEAVGLSLGVHIANGRRGRVIPGVLTSAGILGVFVLAGSEVPVLFLALPVMQLAGVIQMERRTARPRG
jgi:hypothetical protein